MSEAGVNHLTGEDLMRAMGETGFLVGNCLADDDSMASFILSIAGRLGTVVKGRRSDVEILTPTRPDEAEPRSLSALFGKGSFPWHMDTAHRPQPVRFIVLGCSSCAEDAAPIHMTEWRPAIETLFSHGQLRSSLFLVRTGKSSFYASGLDEGGRFLRHDPGCMTPANAEAELVQERLQNWTPQTSVKFNWTAGAVLVIDNWRLLHRRGDTTSSGVRRLLRCYAA